MNILAAATPPPTPQPTPYQPPTPQPSPYQPTQQQMLQQQQMQQAYQQQMAMQEGRPAAKPSLKQQLLGQGLFLFNIAVIVFVIVMVYRFVRATEKIAESLKLAIPRKDDTPTQSQT